MNEFAGEISDTDALKAIKGVARTDIGRRREENQDSYGIIDNESFKLFSVADGMGGVKGGAIASALAINVVREMLGGKDTLTPEELQAALHAVNLQIYEKGLAEPTLAGMGTTYVGLGFSGTQMFIVNVGDSRAYRVRRGTVTRLTEDHTVVTELVRSGAITPEQALNHPVSHMLTRSLGPVPEVLVDCWLCEDGPYRGDHYLLCSDGLYNLVGDDEIQSMLETHPIDNAVEMLVDLANERGGTDNITVIAIEIGAEFPVEADNAAAAETTDEQESPADGEVNGSAGSKSEEPAATEAASAPNESAEPNPVLRNKLSFNSFQPSSAPEQTVESSPPAASQPARRRGGMVIGFLFGVCVAGGVLLFNRPAPAPQPAVVVDSGIKPAYPSQIESKPKPTEAPAAAATAEPVRPAVETVTANAGAPVAASTTAPDAHPAESATAHSGVTMPDESVDLMARRRETLQLQLTDLDAKIGAFDKPLSGDAGRILGEAGAKREKLQAQLTDAMTKMDGATRRLAIWYGRRKRLGEEDPINMASEIAVSSDEVKKKKEEFDTATWGYLKEFEVLSYNPNDEQQKTKVRDLVQERRRKAEALTQAVKSAIERAVGEADQFIAELTVTRSQIENEIGKLKNDVDFVRVLTGSDAAAKRAKREELAQERDIVQAELNELNRANPQEQDGTIAQ